MAPTSFKCNHCDKAFYGRQKRLPCKGPCEGLFHPDCVKVKDEEFDVLMINGVSSFVCDSCSRLPRNDDTPVAVAGGNRSRKTTVTKRKAFDENDGNVEIETVTKCYCDDLVPKLFGMIEKLEGKVNALIKVIGKSSSDVEDLKKENRILTERINLLVVGNKPTQNGGDTALLSFSKAVKGKTTKNLNKKEANVVECIVEESKFHDEIGQEMGLLNEKSPEKSSVEWTTVTSKKQKVQRAKLEKLAGIVKRNKKLIVGNSASGSHLVKPRSRSLFVTRFEPITKAEDIEKLVKDAAAVTDVTCTKLNTKREGYSSFHVSIPEADYQNVSAPEVWPKGVLVLPFYGKLKADQIFKDAEKEIAQVDGSLQKNNGL